MKRRTFIQATGAISAMAYFPSIISAAPIGETEAQRDARMSWWRDARFGMFIHWGIYSIPAGTWNGKALNKMIPSEWIMNGFKIPDAEYSKLAAKFNPVKFDAEEWAAIAKNAGMKYMVITSKHHDGFSMFDSKVTDYDIVDATPFKRDVIGELAKSTDKAGVRFGLYYSQLDWHRFTSASSMAKSADFPKYMEFMKAQLRELLTGYGPIATMFFDGDWMPQWSDALGREVEDLIRSIQPNTIINNRLGKRPMMNHVYFFLKKAHRMERPAVGDYATPEQLIPAELPDCDWETCMTMNDSWGFKTSDHNWKGSTELIRQLVDVVSKNGNYLLNVGPTSEGKIPPESVESLGEIGRWMSKHGDSIYGTTAGPIQGAPWGRSTKKPGKIFAHVFDRPANGELILAGLASKAERAIVMGEAAELSLSAKGSDLVVKLPDKMPDAACSVVEIKVK